MRATGPATGSRSPTVDGLRGLAAVLVVVDHAVGDALGLGAWSEQNHSITAFALLTGFLLSGPFLRARLDGRPAPATPAFPRARAARIFPGYWVALAFAAVTIGLHAMGPGDELRGLTLTQTLGRRRRSDVLGAASWRWIEAPAARLLRRSSPGAPGRLASRPATP